MSLMDKQSAIPANVAGKRFRLVNASRAFQSFFPKTQRREDNRGERSNS